IIQFRYEWKLSVSRSWKLRYIATIGIFYKECRNGSCICSMDRVAAEITQVGVQREEHRSLIRFIGRIVHGCYLLCRDHFIFPDTQVVESRGEVGTVCAGSILHDGERKSGGIGTRRQGQVVGILRFVRLPEQAVEVNVQFVVAVKCNRYE